MGMDRFFARAATTGESRVGAGCPGLDCCFAAPPGWATNPHAKPRTEARLRPTADPAPPPARG